MGFTTATVVAEQRGDIVQITTGCKEFDTVLEGAARAGVTLSPELDPACSERSFH